MTTAWPRVKLSSSIHCNPNMLTSDLVNESVMLNIDHNHYYGVESIGHIIWTQLQQSTVVAKLIDSLLARFSVDRETCTKEVIDFLTELHKEQLIIIDNGANSAD